MSRPVCVHCGASYGKRDIRSETIKWPLDQERPSYRGNGVVTREGEPYKTMSRDTLRRVRMAPIGIEAQTHFEAELAKVPEESFWTAIRWVWDGESYWGGYEPFCTLRCALDYARKTYRREAR